MIKIIRNLVEIIKMIDDVPALCLLLQWFKLEEIALIWVQVLDEHQNSMEEPVVL